MTMAQYVIVTAFAQKHHAFAQYRSKSERAQRVKDYPSMGEYGYSIKYIDCTYDSRTKNVWCVTFRQGARGYRFSTNHFNALNPQPKGWKYTTLYDLCMAFLKGEFKPKEEFVIDFNEDATDNDAEKETHFLLVSFKDPIAMTAYYFKNLDANFEENGNIEYAVNNPSESKKFKTWIEAYNFAHELSVYVTFDIVSNVYAESITYATHEE